jgi:hypothetical protein
MGRDSIGTRYLEHLTDRDLELLAQAADKRPPEMRARPGLLEDALASQSVYERLFRSEPGSDQIVASSPFLAFAVLVHRCAEELAHATFVQEWVGPRQRLPLFDPDRLSGFLGEPALRLFIAELLASYTHVASGSVMVRDRHRWRRHRFSELDPVRLASLLEVVPEEDRPGIYRRLGDLALFLTGVFPDRSATWSLSPVNAARLASSGAAEDRVREEAFEDGRGTLEFLEELGRRWYRLAYTSASSPQTYSLRVVANVAERFNDARRVLNVITDRHLFPFRAQWFTDLA